MKRALALILTWALLLLLMPTSLFNIAASAATSGYYTYTVSNGEATITDCSASISGTITIPSQLGGYPVTEIGEKAFYDCSNLTYIYLPDGVTRIGDYAFFGCTGLTYVFSLNSVTNIGNYAFYDCDSLTSINIPEKCNSIGNYAFYGCDSLTSINIPEKCNSIGSCAFNRCTNLREIRVDNDNSTYSSDNKGVLYNKNKTLLIRAPQKLASSYSIPDGVINIDNYAFHGCTSLTNVTIPNSVTSIGDYAFYECSNLIGVKIPVGVTSIGFCAFYGCSSLTNISIPAGVTSIGNSTFCGCSSLTNISIPAGVTSIGDSMFYGCSSLTNISIPAGVTSIGYTAFYGCSNLTSISIPASVASIGTLAFSGCSSLTTVIYNGSIEQWGQISIRSNNSALTTANMLYNTYTATFNENGADKCGYKVTLINDKTGEKKCVYLNAGESFSPHNYWKPEADGYIYAGWMYQSEVLSDTLKINCDIELVPKWIANPKGYPVLGDTTSTVSTYLNYDDMFYHGYRYREQYFYVSYDYERCGYSYTTPSYCYDRDEKTGSWGYISTSKGTVANGNSGFGWPVGQYYDGEYPWNGSGEFNSEPDILYRANVSVTGNPSQYPLSYVAIGATPLVKRKNIGKIEADNSVEFGSIFNTPTVIREGYQFLGWYDSQGNQMTDTWQYTGNQTFTAKWEEATYHTVTFKDIDGNIISSEIYYLSENIIAPELPTKDPDNTYTYSAKWDNNYTGVCTGDAVYSPIFEQTYIDYIVTFKNWDGTVISSKTHHYGDSVVAPPTPIKEANSTYTYVFVGWDQAVVDCTGDATYTATFTSNYIDYTVVFKNWNGDVLSTKTYHYGDKVTVPSDPTREADGTSIYIFAGWDTPVGACVGNTTYTATYTVHTDHIYDNDCDKECNICGNMRTITHKYEWVIDEENTCGVDGVKHEECSVCHITQNVNTIIPATGNHAYDNRCDTDCNICGGIRTIEHDYKWIVDQEENCGKNGIKHEECTVCHATQNAGTTIAATGNHTYDNACDTACNVCRYVRGVGEHVYDNVCDSSCDICGFVRSDAEHKFESITCSLCGYVCNHTDIDAYDLCSSCKSYGICGPDLTCVIDGNGTLTISGTGRMYDYEGGQPWSNISTLIKNVVIESGVTTIGDEAFGGYTSIQSVTIPNSVTRIGVYAFYGCDGLTSVIIPDSITSINSGVFYGCDNLISITIPDSVTEIGYDAFYNCTSLSAVVYCGTQEQWDAVNIGSRNTPLQNATLQLHKYENGTCVYCENIATYTVMFKDWDNAILASDTYHYGNKVTIPVNPTREADDTYTYTFAGWDKNVVNCTGDATYTATYTSTYIDYTVVFKDWDGKVLSTKNYHWGDEVTAPANPTKEADNTCTYTFVGWDNEVVACAGNVTYTATYTSTYIDYTVTFKNWDGSVLASDKYHYNDTVTPPSDMPTKPEDSTYKYVFKGWDSEIVKVVGNKIYTAIYDAIKKIVEITSNVFHIQGDSIGKVGTGTSASSFVSKVDQAENVKVYKGNTQISGNTAIGTGMEVKLMDGNTVVKSYTVVVTGDTNGDGVISVTDMIAVKAHVLKKTLLTGAYADAGDTSNDNAISITDFIQIKAQILGKSSIVPN